MPTVRYWAGARAAAGVAEESVDAACVGDAIARITQTHPGLDDVLPQCAVLVDGHRVEAAAPLAESDVVEILPPFAGG